jgi:uncharacterized protein with NRDE domain
MCCLTIYKTKDDKLVVTHNRDEQWSRQADGAHVVEHEFNGKKIWMPKDNLSEGTWIGSDGKNTAAILNGFKENHIKKPNYRASRGTIIPQFLSDGGVDSFIKKFDPSGLEPFTLIMVDSNDHIVEYGWDETNIHISNYSSDNPLIYSSPTLYNSDICERRENHFKNFIQKKIDHNDIWKFHETKGDDHGHYINVKYNDEISTVAISQIVTGDQSVFYYQSLINNNSKQSLILL